jgi:hypothetical protein
MKKKTKTKTKTKALKIKLITSRHLEAVTGGGLIGQIKPEPSCSQCTTFPK